MPQQKKLSLPQGCRNTTSRREKPKLQHSVETVEKVKELLAQKKQLAQTLAMTERRLTFGSSSQPLDDYYLGLKKQDMQLACQLTDLLA